jgi:hypothetical protein
MLANWFFKKEKNDDIISSLDLSLFISLDNDTIGKIIGSLNYKDILNVIITSKSLSEIIINAKENILSDYKLSRRHGLELLKEFSCFKNTKKNDNWEKLKKLKLEEDKEYAPNILIEKILRGDRIWTSSIDEIQVLTSIKIKGSFESITFELGAQNILRIHPIQLQIQQKDADGFIEILNMNHLNIYNIPYHERRLVGRNCDIQYKIAGYNYPNNQVRNYEQIYYPIKQISYYEKINIKDKEHLKYKCHFNLSAICIIIIVKPDKLKSVELNLDNEIRKIDAKYLKIEDILHSELYNYNIPFENCYYIPLFNLFSSQIKSFKINFEFEKKDNYSVEILYINENKLITMHGMAGLCLAN